MENALISHLYLLFIIKIADGMDLIYVLDAMSDCSNRLWTSLYMNPTTIKKVQYKKMNRALIVPVHHSIKYLKFGVFKKATGDFCKTSTSTFIFGWGLADGKILRDSNSKETLRLYF